MNHVSFSSPQEFVIGVDIGGTKIAAGLVDHAGMIHSQIRTRMAAHEGPQAGLAAVTAAIDLVLAEAEGKATIQGIGICSPGPLDPRKGIVINPPNLPCWRNFPLAAEVSSRYSVPVKVDNDGNAAALAEVLWGAGKAYQNVFYGTIGTGIGTGIIFDRKIYHGRTGAAAEGGHVSIDYRGPRCACGKPGCIEALAAGPAIAKRARTKLMELQQNSPMLELAGGDINAVTSEIVGQAYAAGDALAKEVLQEISYLLTVWLSNMIDLLEPDAIVVGGGAAAILRPFFAEMHANLAGLCINPRPLEIPLLPAYYGADSGIAGGAALCSNAVI
jgi:glucokinase